MVLPEIVSAFFAFFKQKLLPDTFCHTDCTAVSCKNEMKKLVFVRERVYSYVYIIIFAEK